MRKAEETDQPQQQPQPQQQKQQPMTTNTTNRLAPPNPRTQQPDRVVTPNIPDRPMRRNGGAKSNNNTLKLPQQQHQSNSHAPSPGLLLVRKTLMEQGLANYTDDENFVKNTKLEIQRSMQMNEEEFNKAAEKILQSHPATAEQLQTHQQRTQQQQPRASPVNRYSYSTILMEDTDL